MRKLMTAGLAALTLAGGALAGAAPAQADPWRGHYDRDGYRDHDGYRDRGGDAGAAIFAGVAGLALGAALADNHRYYGPPPPPRYYYGDPYYRPYATCYARRTVWDPYIGHYVVVTRPYAC
jgi:hypothetical protein